MVAPACCYRITDGPESPWLTTINAGHFEASDAAGCAADPHSPLFGSFCYMILPRHKSETRGMSDKIEAAEFSFLIRFAKGTGDPRRVFDAASPSSKALRNWTRRSRMRG
jgi:hypothetical protein